MARFYSRRIAAEQLSGFFVSKVQAIHDGRFRPAGETPKVSDDRIDFFLPHPMSSPRVCRKPRIIATR